MGRMAGQEMNYGSDLDLIFLYDNTPGLDIAGLNRNIQQMLRYIALPSPGGVLYEIDTRLRPHGTSGTLISPASYFVEYHQQQREIWERQMMTRCLPVIDPEELAAHSLEQITSFIYAGYDGDILRNEIVSMRGRVEKELGTPKGKFEIKRGCGGIMDVDFITHYLQLLHGSQYPELRTASTRNALAQLKNLRILHDDEADALLKGYDYLKRAEGVLRVADMKNINSFPQDPAEVGVLARAMGHYETDKVVAGEKFIEEYLKNTQQIRLYFNQLTGQTG
jgi:glutamate-ammonia-ligase adenylyltransferase